MEVDGIVHSFPDIVAGWRRRIRSDHLSITDRLRNLSYCISLTEWVMDFNYILANQPELRSGASLLKLIIRRLLDRPTNTLRNTVGSGLDQLADISPDADIPGVPPLPIKLRQISLKTSGVDVERCCGSFVVRHS